MKLKKAIIILSVAMVLTAKADDATSTTPAPDQEKKPKWNSLIGVGFTLTSGNSDTMLATANFKTGYKGPVNELGFGADAAYGEDSGNKNNETLHGFGQWNYLFSEKLFAYLRTDVLHDGIADLDYRFTIGPGVGYYLLKQTNTTLAVETGPSIILQRLGGVDNTYVSWRLAERFEHKFAQHGARVWESVEFLPEVTDPKNFLMNAEVGVESAITKSLNLQVYLVDNYVNEPAPGRKSNDLKLVSGLAYKF